MGESKIPKPTAKLTLTLLERLTIHQALRILKPKDRDDERAINRAWDAVDLDGAVDASQPAREREATLIAIASGQVTGHVAASAASDCLRRSYSADDLKKSKSFEVTLSVASVLDSIPPAETGDHARVLAPMRDKIEAAIEAIKAKAKD